MTDLALQALAILRNASKDGEKVFKDAIFLGNGLSYEQASAAIEELEAEGFIKVPNKNYVGISFELL